MFHNYETDKITRKASDAAEYIVVWYFHQRSSCMTHLMWSTAELHADAVGLARQLAGSLQEQLQQQRTDVREQLQQATAREQRPQHEALEREHRQAAETRRMQEDACKAQEAAYNIELERARQADRREDRLFDQFLECTDKTRSDLNEAALLRERAARLELELQHACEAAAAAVERTQPAEVAPPAVSEYFASGTTAATGKQPPISRKLAKKMRHFFASAITESDV